jgi:hypothetical protein
MFFLQETRFRQWANRVPEEIDQFLTCYHQPELAVKDDISKATFKSAEKAVAEASFIHEPIS